MRSRSDNPRAARSPTSRPSRPGARRATIVSASGWDGANGTIVSGRRTNSARAAGSPCTRATSASVSS